MADAPGAVRPNQGGRNKVWIRERAKRA